MASASKARVIHRETFQNANQMVEVLIRTKPKLTTAKAPVSKKSTFKRNCPLKNQLDQITEEHSSTDAHHQRVSRANKQDTQNGSKKLNNDMVVEVSKSKRNSRKRNQFQSPDQTWADVFKSYSSIREEESNIDSTSSDNPCADDHTDHVPSRGPKTKEGCSQANRSVQTSQFFPKSKDYGVKAFQLDRPSFTDKETTVPLHMQVLSENFENVGRNQQILKRHHQSQHGRANQPPEHQTRSHQLQTGTLLSGHHTNVDVHQEQNDRMVPDTRQEKTRGQIPTAEEARLLSDGLSSTPFSDSALQLLQQLRQKLHLRGDSEGSEMLGVLEQFFVSGAPTGRRQHHLPSSPDQSLCNTVFNTPAAQPANTNGHPHPGHGSHSPHHVYHQPHTGRGSFSAAYAPQQPHGASSGHQTGYPQQRYSPQSGEQAEAPPQYVEQLRRQLSEQQQVALQQAATIAELRSLSSRLLALQAKTRENSAVLPVRAAAVQTTGKPVVQETPAPTSSASSAPTSVLTGVSSSVGPRTLAQSALHAAPPGTDDPQREDGSSRPAPAAPIMNVHNDAGQPMTAGGRGTLNTRGVTFGSLPHQHTQLQGTDTTRTTADSLRASQQVLENKQGNGFPHQLPRSDAHVERRGHNSHSSNDTSPHHGAAVEQARLPDQLPSAGWVTTDPPGERGLPIPLPHARGVPSSTADDRMQRAALWSMHCEKEMLKRQLRQARQPQQSSHTATTAEAVANPSRSSSPGALPQQQPLTSTRRSPPVPRSTEEPVGDSDSAFDERTSSKFGSKRPSPSEGDGVPPHLLGLSSVPHAVPRSDSAAFRVTNTLPTNAQGLAGTRSTFRSTAPHRNVAATDVDTDMLRTTRERQQTTVNPSVCNASTIPNDVLRDRQQPSPLASPPSSSAGPRAFSSSLSEHSIDRSLAGLTNPNYANLYLSAVGQHAPSSVLEVEQHSELLLSTISALSEDEQSLAPVSSRHPMSNHNSRNTEGSRFGGRFVNCTRESAAPVAQFSVSSSTISSCSMAQSIARQGQETGTPLLVPRPLESTRLQSTQPRASARSCDGFRRHGGRASASSSGNPGHSDLISASSINERGVRNAVPGRSVFEASSQFQSLPPEVDSSVGTLRS